jgi:hypothetical protein
LAEADIKPLVNKFPPVTLPVALTVLVDINTPEAIKLPPVTLPAVLTVLVANSTPGVITLPPVTFPVALTVLVDINTPDAIKLAPEMLPVATTVVALVVIKLPKVVMVTLKVPALKSAGTTVAASIVRVCGNPVMLVVAIVVPYTVTNRSPDSVVIFNPLRVTISLPLAGPPTIFHPGPICHPAPIIKLIVFSL